ncbi:MAG TPA: phosphoribosyltransferase family protein [Methanocella sp.]|uniref:phosphoribosyltransferase n=1 Tax=Methanocella sp. TaxID=2052833 RepID=UPI002D129FFC|nr:phosphoribosyltransferase family protein [Methanocella sp.]HTY90856.1 phosphoribosyltransferase family protein [Methanocella sp.]
MIYRDRRDAGRRLAEHLLIYRHNAVVLAIPRGGVPVGYEVAKRLEVPLDLIIPRKLPIPSDPEAGFGAIAPDGTIVLNERLVAYCGLSAKDIERIAGEVLAEVLRRIREYRGDRPQPELKHRNVIIVDDGLASGYTMVAAVRAVKRERPKRVIVAVPCSPESSVGRLEKEADEVVSLAVQPYGQFAVAGYYESFPDLSDEEVKRLITQVPAA